MVNRVPGLRPQGDRPSVGGGNRGRVQAPTGAAIRAPGLNPVARPVDTYARPQAPAEGNDMLQLAKALGQISPSLNNLLTNEATAARKHAENLAARRLGGMTFEQHQQFIQSGGPEMQDPWFKAAAMRMFGERQALFRVNELTQQYATSFDKQNGNIDEFISSAVAADLEAYGGDEHFMGAYGPVMDNFRGKATAQHTADMSAFAVEQAKAGVYETFLGNATAMLGEGKTPEEVVTALRGRYAGNANLLNIPYHEQDAEWLRVAEAFAQQGNLDMVKAMLNSERTGPNGEVMGSISTQREFAADSARILSTATAKMEEGNLNASLAARMKFDQDARSGILNEDELLDFHAQNPGVYSIPQILSLQNQNQSVVAQLQQEAATAADKATLQRQSVMDELNVREANLGLVEGNRVPFIQDATVRNERGENITITADQQRKWLAQDISEQVQVIKDQNGLNDDQAFDLETAQFTMAGINNPTWESILAAGPVAANAWSLSGEPPPSLVAGAEMYMRLHAKSPVLLNRHLLDAETRRFYETYRTAVEIGRMEPSQAYSHAANIVRNPPIDNPMTTLPKGDLEGVVRRIGNGNGGWFGIGNGTANNEAYVSDWVMRRVGEYGSMGTMTASAAAQEAEKDFLNQHTSINGQWVNTADRFIPPNFDELAKTVIEDYARDFPDEDGGLTPDELTLVPANNGTGSWMLVLKGGTPFPVDDPQRRYVTLQSMQQGVDVRTQRAREELEATQSANQQETLLEQSYQVLENAVPPNTGPRPELLNF